MNYLLYVEHAAENLQFYLWLRDYEKRWQELPQADQELSPPWDSASVIPEAQTPASIPKTEAARSAQKILAQSELGTKSKPTGAGAFPGNASASFLPPGSANPFNTPPRTPNKSLDGDTPTTEIMPWDAASAPVKTPHYTETAADAFAAVDIKWQPFTIQPFRDEITRVVALYIAEGSPRELNLSNKEHAAVLHALTHTTHPSVFSSVKSTIEWSLRQQAHPNFVRWSLCNGNRPRVIFARGLGVALIVIGFVISIIMILSEQGKGMRAIAAAAWVLGISTLFAAWNGMCVVLHGFHHRHLRPWELWTHVYDSEMELKEADPMDLLAEGPNSYEDKPWDGQYKKRNIVRKVFDREVWVEEPALRQIQDAIFYQSIASGIVIAAVLVGITMAIPKGNLY